MISEQDVERLSVYLDNALSTSEKAALEDRLAREPELRAYLRDLRLQTRAFRDLPRLTPPRAFTLTAKQAAAIRPPARPSLLASLFPALRLSTALSTVAFLVAVGGNLLNAGRVPTVALSPSAAEVALSTDAANPAAATEAVAGAALAPEADVAKTAADVTATPGADLLARQSATAVGTDEVANMFSMEAVSGTTAAGAAPVEETPVVAVTPDAVVAAAPPAPADQVEAYQTAPPVDVAAPAPDPWPAWAAGLGVLTAVLAALTWLARRRTG